MTDPPRILVACIGNIFLGDDAFGVHVAQALLRRPLPPEAVVVDFGIKGLDLAYALLEDWSAAIFVDAMPRGRAPGTLELIEPDLSQMHEPPAPFQAHSLDPASVLRLVRSLGGVLKRILVLGCEPMPLDSLTEMEMGLSPPVRAAVEPAAQRVESLLSELLSEIPTAGASKCT